MVRLTNLWEVLLFALDEPETGVWAGCHQMKNLAKTYKRVFIQILSIVVKSSESKIMYAIFVCFVDLRKDEKGEAKPSLTSTEYDIMIH